MTRVNGVATVRRLWWKRPFDLLLVAVAAVPALVVGLAVALAVWRALGRPILFRQMRPGLGGRPFEVVKFRSMRDGAGTDEERVTPFGAWLRSTSLDELPELWNVVKGEMSVVGPRPLLMEYLGLYDDDQFRRHSVRPGLTGWAQIHGRNAQSWDQRFRLDQWYVDHASLRLDIRIIWRTIGIVLRREGVRKPGHATIERFRGNA